MYRGGSTRASIYQQCPRHYYYRYKRRLSKEESTPQALQIGRAVAKVLEMRFLGVEDIDVGVVMEGVGCDPVYRDHVERCLSAVPPELYSEGNLSLTEDSLSVMYIKGEDGWRVAYGEVGDSPAITYVGQPDLWYIERDDNGRGVGIHIVEVKTTSATGAKAVSNYEYYRDWDEQALRYGVLLRDYYIEWRAMQELPLYRRYLMLPYSGKGGFFSPPLPITKELLDKTRQNMLDLTYVAETDPLYLPHFSKLCDWVGGECTFAPLCRAERAGLDIEDIVNEQYRVRGE